MGLLDRLRKKTPPTVAAPQASSVTTTTAPVKSVVSPTNAAAQLTAGDVLVRPVVTEKATVTGTYLFEVRPNANKQEVAKAITQLYGVTPASVRVMNVRGKVVRWQQSYGKRKNWKKAVVRLKKGETMSVYQGT